MKVLKILAVVLLALVATAAGLYFFRYAPMLGLFAAEKKASNFRHMEDIFPAHEIEPAAKPSVLAVSSLPFPDSVTLQGQRVALLEELNKLSTTGLLVLRNDSILFETYLMGATAEDHFTSWSVSKSVTSTLIGIAAGEGKIASIQDPVDKYLPYLKGSGFEGVSIQHVLQMASGIRFSEKYDDPNSDINQMMYKQFVYFQSLPDWIKGFQSEETPGETFEYQSINTILLGLLLAEVYGKTLAEVLEEKIWQPMGAEGMAWWNTDEYDNEMAFGFLNARLRDYGRFGLMMLHGGNWNGRQIVSSDWVTEATTLRPGEPHPAKEEGDTQYQYHWWIPQTGDPGEFMASGYMGQCVYVNPYRNVVIVKTGTEEVKHLPLLQAIAREIGTPVLAPGPADTVMAPAM